ncbi:hypothetical protein PTSG_00032 [Salpingoeca rosetta]|uniref:Tubulin polyglutamylase complex subunit 1-like C-terminal domain-containing protein n=1 Tax=Salpingoeca rosetta (strain ATCC 50818 / BSB-021) TaxID=946362 RepID=F2TVC0_SALR5|nr:uncharacterized protein PTSG_00032 [Salpingoeca rosetta]EGD72016.1 hypothetical protein PTSG_00032 [Salpingoeca rosetta]|eukprot:XP_004998588.1 hypothetical protein PTSG_00032 [Salpingoeca rosetta]
MRELLRIRPADPMSFLADYFTHVTTGVPAVQRAYKLIRHATGNPHFRRAEAIAEAYTLLSVNQHNTLDRTYGSLRTRHKNTSPEGASGGSKKRKKTRHSSSSSKASAPSPDISGALSSVMLAPPSSKQVTNSLDGLLVNRQGLDAVLGVDFMQLLGMRTSDFSPQVSEALCTRYMRADHAVVTWPHFKEALTVCYQYEELLEQGRALFLLLDPFNTGLAKEDICQQLIDFLLLEASPAAADVAAVDAALTSAIKDAQARGMATNQQDMVAQ